MTDYTCKRCGRCCLTEYIEVKPAELEEMRNADPEAARKLKLVDLYDGGFQINPPCPFYSDGCSIYEKRPAMCRIFLSGRQSFDDAVRRERFDDPEYHTARAEMLEDGIAWARQHGWYVPESAKVAHGG